MARLNVLCGLNNMKEFDEVERRVGKILLEYGIEASFQVRTNKVRVKEYVENNDCEVVILQEKIDNKKWTAEEVAQLTEQKDVNVIIVLSDRYIGKEYVMTLLAANITNAIFQKGRNGGASAKDIADLIVKKRSRKDARAYYGIGNQKIDLGILDEDTYVEYYKDLKDERNSLLKNYVDCCAKMNLSQIADFTKRLPEDDLDELKKFEEFYTIMQLLKEAGFDLKIKKPKKTMIGLSVPQQICFKGSRTGVDSSREKNEESDKGEEEKMEASGVNISETDMENMSAADLFACISGDYVVEESVSDDLVESDKLSEETSSISDINEEITDNIEVDVETDMQEQEIKEAPSVSIECDKVVESEKVSLEENSNMAMPDGYFSKEDIEKARKEAMQEVKEKYERRLREVNALNQEVYEKKEEEILRRQFSIINEQEGEKIREGLAYQKEIERLKKKQSSLERKLEKYSDSDDGYILDAGGKQFSWGIIIVMVALVAIATGLLYFKPVLF